MEYTSQKLDSKISDLVAHHGFYRNAVWLAHARNSAKGFAGLGFKVKAFLVAVSIICFSYGAFSGATIKTMIEAECAKAKAQEAAAILISLPLSALGEVQI